MFTRTTSRSTTGDVTVTPSQEAAPSPAPAVPGSYVTTPPATRAAPSTIGANLRVNGDLSSDGEIQLDGTVQGNVRGRLVTIGESGTVTGEVHAETVRVLGNVTGPITAKVVELARSAHVTGEVRHESLTIEAGAYIDGHCRRLDADARSEERLALVHNKA